MLLLVHHTVCNLLVCHAGPGALASEQLIQDGAKGIHVSSLQPCAAISLMHVTGHRLHRAGHQTANPCVQAFTSATPAGINVSIPQRMQRTSLCVQRRHIWPKLVYIPASSNSMGCTGAKTRPCSIQPATSVPITYVGLRHMGYAC